MSKDFFPPNDSFSDVISKIVRVPPPNKVETKTHVIHLTPRISAAKLAEYAVADHTRQETIAKDSKIARIVLTAPYTRVRSTIPKAFAGGKFEPDILLQRAIEIEASPGRTDWYKRDDRYSAEVLRKLAKIIPLLDLGAVRVIPRPKEGWGELIISGVRVSVNPEVVFTFQGRGITKMGAIILNTPQLDSGSLARKSGDYCSGQYLASLVHRMLGEKLISQGKPINGSCFAIDVWRDAFYSAPGTHITLNKQMAAACKMIALRWDTIKPPGAIDDDSDATSEESVADDLFPF